ncbi:MAG: D-2-hydroxyacid dehydrogenase [Gammaproteobacteria bacterium]|nr:D-2-hydroxyacid dehydrogenase [Gammaproteobacteria bacterium]MDH3434375.1 D-2-hydroxyacid dehydrogenase [Gammaproteobacteria bacterium]
MKAVFLDYATVGPGLDTGPLSALLPDLTIFDATDDSQVPDRIRDVEFVFANKIRIYDELFDAANKLRFIGLTATGVDNIDLDSAASHGVAVCNIRGYCTRAVTEHVFGVLLTLAHSLHRYSAAVRDGAWQEAQNFCMLRFPLRELSTMTMGVVGHGELGSAVARRARDFDMPVLVSARPGSETVDADRVSFDELLLRSDVISLHCPLTDQTRGLFGAAEFRKMKSSAILINTARGALVDSAALVDALQSGEIAAAAIDVLPKEPPVDGNPLLDYTGENLIVTPHIAWATDRSRQDSIHELAANVAAFLNGERRNRVV